MMHTHIPCPLPRTLNSVNEILWQAMTSKPITECRDEGLVRERRREREGEMG